MNKREIILALTKLILSRVALESMRKSNCGNLYVQGDFILVWEFGKGAAMPQTISLKRVFKLRARTREELDMKMI